MRILLPQDADYDQQTEALVRRSSVVPRQIEERAREIVEDVRTRGDVALREWTEKLEGRPLTTFELPPAEWREASKSLAPEVMGALTRAAARIRTFSEKWRETGFEQTEPGIRLGLRVEPLARVGLYVPGGTARYPSTVLMTAIPARAAGVREIVMTTPGPSPETLAAAALAGVDRVFVLGGAQAIAALAYGTAKVPRVDKIVGPGNAYVAAAKRIVFGQVDIDGVAGPSEVLILADQSANPRLVAADLLAQAEHDAEAYAVAATPSQGIANEIVRQLDLQLEGLPRRAIAEAALRAHGAVVVTPSLDGAIDFANRFAPEHLELMVEHAPALVPRIRTAGACFVGAYTPEAVGDYFAGPNHVLPTGGAARYRSPLGCWDFVRRSTVIEYAREALAAQAQDVLRLTEVEGLAAHGRAISLRLEETKS